LTSITIEEISEVENVSTIKTEKYTAAANDNS
jgi:hypothetical protein